MDAQSQMRPHTGQEGSESFQTADLFAALRVLADLPALICICRGDRIEAINAEGRAILGLESVADAVGEPFDTFLSTDYQGLGAELIDMIVEEPAGVRLKLAARCAPRRDIEIKAILVGELPDGLHVLHGTDITERINSVEMLHQRESRYRSIIDNATALLCETVGGKIMSVNTAGDRLIGATRAGEIVGRPLASLFHADYADLFGTELKSLAAEGEILPTRMICLDGRVLDVEVSMTALDGAVADHLLVEVRDITSHNRAVGALRELNENLEQRVEERTRALREAERRLAQTSKLEALGTFAGGIAHEINTPIQFITDNLKFLSSCFDEMSDLILSYEGLARVVRLGGDSQPVLTEIEEKASNTDITFLTEEAPSAIHQSVMGVSHIAKVVQAMREFAGSDDAALSALDLNRLVLDAAKSAAKAVDGVAEIRCHVADGPVPVLGASDELARVLDNLIDNARQAIRYKRAGIGHIAVRLESTAHEARIVVSDDGVGITPDVRERMFDPFFTTREVGAGIGQGLAICHHIVVDRHNGRIDVETEPGKGSTFTVVLPRASASDAAHQESMRMAG